MIHEAPPASDAEGSPRKMGFQSMVALVFFIAVLVLFVGLLTGFIDRDAVFGPVGDFVNTVGGWITKLIAK